VPREPETRLAFSTGGEGEAAPETKLAPAATGRSPGIRLRLERRASGRLATVVTGLPGSAAEVAGLAKALKARCAAGGTLKDGVLELQGDQRERIEAALGARGLKSKRAGG
jgi:translation initiation factor 1